MIERSPIGWDGLTLLEMIEQSERQLSETGFYCGVRDLSLRRATRFATRSSMRAFAAGSSTLARRRC